MCYDKRSCRVRDLSATGVRLYLHLERWCVNGPRCGGVHLEHFDWLATNPRYTQRYARYVGKLYGEMTNKAVAELEHLHDRPYLSLRRGRASTRVRFGPDRRRAAMLGGPDGVSRRVLPGVLQAGPILHG